MLVSKDRDNCKIMPIFLEETALTAIVMAYKHKQLNQTNQRTKTELTCTNYSRGQFMIAKF